MRQYDDLLIDALLDRGFSIEEAQRLIALQDRVERDRQRWETGARPSDPTTPPSKGSPDYDDPRAR
jgi:hypothetical protein